MEVKEKEEREGRLEKKGMETKTEIKEDSTCSESSDDEDAEIDRQHNLRLQLQERNKLKNTYYVM